MLEQVKNPQLSLKLGKGRNGSNGRTDESNIAKSHISFFVDLSNVGLSDSWVVVVQEREISSVASCKDQDIRLQLLLRDGRVTRKLVVELHVAISVNAGRPSHHINLLALRVFNLDIHEERSDTVAQGLRSFADAHVR